MLPVCRDSCRFPIVTPNMFGLLLMQALVFSVRICLMGMLGLLSKHRVTRLCGKWLTFVGIGARAANMALVWMIRSVALMLNLVGLEMSVCTCLTLRNFVRFLPERNILGLGALAMW